MSTAIDTTAADLFPEDAAVPAVALSGIASDSRAVCAGDLFLAVPGISGHGLDFVAEATANGAAAVAFDPEGVSAAPAATSVPQFAVTGLKSRLGAIADQFFDAPSRAVRVAGVTGTNGKTTVAWLLAECYRHLGHRAGYLGTIGSGVGRELASASLTTPDVVSLHRTLAEFRDAGAAFAAVEVSSHALDQHRVDGVRFDSALFTNLSRDHLDYHGGMDAYFAAKSRLFLDCKPARRIVCVDSEYGRRLAGQCGPEVVRVATTAATNSGTAQPGDQQPGERYVAVSNVTAHDAGTRIDIDSAWGRASADLRLAGSFNVANSALALAALLANDVSIDAASAALGSVDGPPGRLERVPGEGPAVFVDFAHTPDALAAVLNALRPHTSGRLLVVLGAGGNRDTGKRPLMGQIAERSADQVILTSDNPRNEDPLSIIAAIKAGFDDPAKALVVEDRAAAISRAIRGAASGDTILIAGKGHERFQERHGKRLPFSDRDVAERALAARAGGAA